MKVWMWGDVGMEKDETRMRRWRNRNCLLQMISTWLPKAMRSLRKGKEKRREGKKTAKKGYSDGIPKKTKSGSETSTF